MEQKCVCVMCVCVCWEPSKVVYGFGRLLLSSRRSSSHEDMSGWSDVVRSLGARWLMRWYTSRKRVFATDLWPGVIRAQCPT
jgi:hypothetical protein